MAIHYTCDGCGAAVDGNAKMQDERLATVVVQRGSIILASIGDLCPVCTESMVRAIQTLAARGRKAAGGSDA